MGEDSNGVKGTVAVYSCVGGGPMARLTREMRRRGVDARVVRLFEPWRWSRLMNAGWVGRVVARASALIVFPLYSFAHSLLRTPRYLVTTTNPFLLPTVLTLLKRVHRRSVVPLIYDLYPDALEAVSSRRNLRGLSWMMSALNRACFRTADAVVFIGTRMAEHAIRRYGEPVSWQVIETGADVREFDQLSAENLNPQSDLERWCCEKELVISYVGNLGLMHDWTTLTQGLREWSRFDPNGRVGFVLAAFGPGAEHLRSQCQELSGAHVRFQSRLDDQAWARLLAISDASIVTLRPEARRTCIPSKTFSAMAARNALLVVAPIDSDLGDLVTSEIGASVIKVGDVTAFVSRIQSWLDKPEELRQEQEVAHGVALERYDVKLLAERWTELLKELEPDDRCASSTH